MTTHLENDFNDEPNPLIRLVIREEMVKLLGDYITALVLEQFLYWSKRKKDLKKLLIEERSRRDDKIPELALESGWIWKSSRELRSELLDIASPSTIDRRLVELCDNGYLFYRSNPEDRRDRTHQYRVNLRKIQRDLQALGYALEGYPLLIDPEEKHEKPAPLSIHQNDECIRHSDECILHSDECIRQNGECIRQDDETLPEITTEITLSEITDLEEEGLKTRARGPNDSVFLECCNYHKLKPKAAAKLYSSVASVLQDAHPDAVRMAFEDYIDNLGKIKDPFSSWLATAIETEDFKRSTMDPEQLRRYARMVRNRRDLRG